MELSVVIPAYNEENRMMPFLNDMLNFAKKLRNYEIILVNDGSADGTLKLMRMVAKKNKHIRIISYSTNEGKGYAVKTGMLNARGDFIIFIDIDGSIKPHEIPKMLKLLKKYDVVVGDRSSKKSVIIQPKRRKIIGILFNFYVHLLFGIKVKDNLCGIKGFNKNVAMKIFRNIISRGWIFDVEIFYYASKNKFSIYKMPIEWKHKDKTKMSFIDPFKMLYQLLKLRINLIHKSFQ